MSKHVKNFIHTGLIFGGFGPIIAGIVLLILELANVEIVLNGIDILIMIISTYLMAFVHAASNEFHKVERFSLSKSMLLQFSSIYIVYSVSYIVNDWLPFNITTILIFTSIFVVAYLIIFIIVYISIKKATVKLNNKINSKIS